MSKKKPVTPNANVELVKDTCAIIEQAQKFAHHAVNETLIKRNWLLGMRIQKEVLKDKRAGYGKQVVKKLSCELVKRYGSGFNQANLYHFVDFFNCFHQIFYAVSGKLENSSALQIFNAESRKSPITLSWTHYRILLQESNANARSWYEQEAAREVWSTRTLQRNISSQYYHRMLKSQHKELVHNEMIEKTTHLQDRLEFIKNPVIAEFLGFPQNTTFSESELETSIINNLQRFIMELGKGYAFIARQQHIHTEKEDYYIDLVFYNYLLKSFVLVDLKTTKVTHQDVGQMDMYVRMYDELKRGKGDNPTIGILICADTDDSIARYSVLHKNNRLFAAKYKTYMPTDEELRAEIETQKNFYYLQHGKKNKLPRKSR